MPEPRFRHDDALRDRIAANLAVEERIVDPLPSDPDGAAPREAAVAITLLPGPAGHCVFPVIVRDAGLRDHAGQLGLPGGRMEAGEGPEQAALRELHEELGIDLPAASVIGRLTPAVTNSGYRIHPVVCFSPAPVTVRAEPGEVAEVHEVGLDDLDDGVARAGPAQALPVLGTVIFAPTGEILRRFRELGLHGRQPGPGWPEPRFTWR